MSAKDFTPSRRALLLAAGALPLITGVARGQTAEDALANDILSLFDPHADGTVCQVFHAERLSPAGQRRWPLAEFEQIAAEIATLSGGLDLVSSRRSGTTLWIRARVRRTGVIRTLRVRIDRDDASKVFDVSTSPMPTPYDGPAPNGEVDRETLAVLIDRRVRSSVALDEFSGAVRVVAPDGAAVYEAAFGLADRESGRLNTPDMRFNLGSADKSFTALIIARLVQQGRVSWDTPLAEVLPDYPNRAFAEVCTLRHLATHTAGLGMLFNRSGWEARRPYQRMADLFDVFAAEAPAFAPGSSAAYSNEGFVVLGAVAEAATGRSWYDLLAEWIYQPAGMTRSWHLFFQDLPADAARGYRFHESDHLGMEPRRLNADFVGYRGNCCGGGFSTVRDITAYFRALRAGSIVPRDILEPMVEAARPGLRDYGIGFDVRPAGERRIVGHGGGGPHSGIDGMSGIVWETGWAFSILGNYDAPFAAEVANDIGAWLALQPG